MTPDSAGWSQDWTRRQFVARGGVTAGALALAGLLPARASASPPVALSGEQLAVLRALVSAVLVAVRAPASDAAGLGLQDPDVIAQRFAGLDPDSRANVAALLDAIDLAPTPQSFTGLSDSQRQEFLSQSLAPLALPPLTDTQLAELLVGAAEADGNAAQLMAELDAGTLPQVIDQPSGPEAPDAPPAPPETFPAPAPLPRDVVLANALLAGLELVTTPPQPLLPPPPPTSLPPVVIASVTAELLAGLPDGEFSQGLVDQLTAALDSSQPEPQPLLGPAPVFADALAALVPGI